MRGEATAPAWVYIMASQRNGTLYVGVTTDLARRTFEHREGLVPGFSRDHRCHHLVWYDEYAEVVPAILMEKRLKRWQRSWKLALIERMNPDWDDLGERLNG